MSDTETETTDDDKRAMSETESSGGRRAMSGPQDESYDPLELYDLQRHRNGDETAVLLCSFTNGYQAIAFDVDAGGQLLDFELIGDAPDREKTVGMVEYWLDQNPGGVLGGEPQGSGLLGRLSGLFGGGGESA